MYVDIRGESEFELRNYFSSRYISIFEVSQNFYL
jgi:hypothetical protein